MSNAGVNPIEFVYAMQLSNANSCGNVSLLPESVVFTKPNISVVTGEV